MLDISWTEFLLIGVVALIVIGPKELPAVLRTLGQWTRKMRSMAADFQSQFQEAMREAEMADLKKQVDDIASDIKEYDPLKDVRADIEAAENDLQSSLAKPALMTSAEHNADAGAEPIALDAAEKSAPELPRPEVDAQPGEKDIAAATSANTPESSEKAAQPESAGPAE